VRRLLAWVGGAVGGVVLYRFLARRAPAAAVPASSGAPEPTIAPEPAAEPEVDPRADELRRRLAESRGIVDERDAFEEAETPVDAAEAAGDPDARRRRIHERGRAAAEQMRGQTES
jgi:hypothetical protein